VVSCSQPDDLRSMQRHLHDRSVRSRPLCPAYCQPDRILLVQQPQGTVLVNATNVAPGGGRLSAMLLALQLCSCVLTLSCGSLPRQCYLLLICLSTTVHSETQRRERPQALPSRRRWRRWPAFLQVSARRSPAARPRGSSRQQPAAWAARPRGSSRQLQPPRRRPASPQ